MPDSEKLGRAQPRAENILTYGEVAFQRVLELSPACDEAPCAGKRLHKIYPCECVEASVGGGGQLWDPPPVLGVSDQRRSSSQIGDLVPPGDQISSQGIRSSGLPLANLLSRPESSRRSDF